MIQESINQLISTAGLAARLSPGYDKKIEANELLGKAKSARAGLEAIDVGLSEPGKDISETELSDMRARTGELNKNIYNAKIRAKEGDPLAKYLKKGVSQLPKQEEYTKTIQSIENKLAAKEEEMRKKAMDRMKSSGETKINQAKDFNDFKGLILDIGYNPTQKETPGSTLAKQVIHGLEKDEYDKKPGSKILFDKQIMGGI